MRVFSTRKAAPAIALILGVAAVVDARTSAQSTHPYGIYSDMQAVDGDVSGFELIVLPSSQGDFVVVQQAEGFPQKPVLLTARLGGTRSSDSNTIAFDHPELGPFQGAFSADSLVGEFTHSRYEIRLARGPSFWQ